MTNFERKRNDGPPGVHLAIRLELLAGIRGIIGSQPRRPGERDECQERCDGRDAPFVVPGQYLHHFPTM